MTKMINGCGKELKDGWACGDSIDTDYDYENQIQYVQPILCNNCWIIQHNNQIDCKEAMS